MANIKIAQLTNQTAISDTDLVIVETATSTNKMTVGNFKTAIGIMSLLTKTGKFNVEVFDGNGVGAFKYDLASYIFYAQDLGNHNAYIFGIGSKHLGVGPVHQLTVLHSKTLGLGASNSMGTQVINGALASNIRLVVISFPIG